MKNRPNPTAKTAIALTAAVCVAGAASAAPGFFSDDFDGPTLDAAWTAGGDAGGHLGFSGGTYQMSSDHTLGVKLSRSPGGTLDTYVHSIDLVLDTFLLTGSGGTKTDIKVKSFGADGFMEFVLNSFGDMRLFHNDSDGGKGNIQGNTNLGLSDGDTLNITTVYNAGTDTIDVTYAINGGSANAFYSGTGIDGALDNLITNSVEVEVFKWNDDPTTQAVVGVDHWSLGPVPEPSSLALIGLGAVAMMGRRRR